MWASVLSPKGIARCRNYNRNGGGGNRTRARLQSRTLTSSTGWDAAQHPRAGTRARDPSRVVACPPPSDGVRGQTPPPRAAEPIHRARSEIRSCRRHQSRRRQLRIRLWLASAASPITTRLYKTASLVFRSNSPGAMWLRIVLIASVMSRSRKSLAPAQSGTASAIASSRTSGRSDLGATTVSYTHLTLPTNREV